MARLRSFSPRPRGVGERVVEPVIRGQLGHVVADDDGARPVGVFVSGVAYWYWAKGIRGFRGVPVSVFLYLEPVATLITAILLLQEKIIPCKHIRRHHNYNGSHFS